MALGTVPATHSYLQPVAGSCAPVPGMATEFAGARLGKKPLFPDVRDLCSAHWLLLSLPEVQTKRKAAFGFTPPPMLQSPSLAS